MTHHVDMVTTFALTLPVTVLTVTGRRDGEAVLLLATVTSLEVLWLTRGSFFTATACESVAATESVARFVVEALCSSAMGVMQTKCGHGRDTD